MSRVRYNDTRARSTDITEIRHDRFCIGTYTMCRNTAQPVRPGKSLGHKSRMQPFFYLTWEMREEALAGRGDRRGNGTDTERGKTGPSFIRRHVNAYAYMRFYEGVIKKETELWGRLIDWPSGIALRSRVHRSYSSIDYELHREKLYRIYLRDSARLNRRQVLRKIN